MAGTVVADTLQADSTSTLVLKNGVANTPPTVQDSAGTQIGTFCRAWVNFNGTGTVAIRASFNVSSITDNGTGLYTINLTNAMPDVNYAWSGSAEGQSGMGVGAYSLIVSQYYPTNPTTSALAVGVLTVGNNIFADSRYVDIAVFR